MNGVAKELTEICSNLQSMITHSDTLIKEVNSIAVTDTAQKLSDAEKSIVTCVETDKELVVEIKDNVNSVLAQIKQVVDTGIEAGNNTAVATKDVIDSALTDVKQKTMIMGGISIVCAIVAIVIALVV